MSKRVWIHKAFSLSTWMTCCPDSPLPGNMVLSAPPPDPENYREYLAPGSYRVDSGSRGLSAEQLGAIGVTPERYKELLDKTEFKVLSQSRRIAEEIVVQGAVLISIADVTVPGEKLQVHDVSQYLIESHAMVHSKLELYDGRQGTTQN